MIESVQNFSNGIAFHFSGNISLNDLEHANDIFHTDERFEYLTYSIWHLDNGNFNDITKQDIMRIVAADLGASHTLTHAHKTAIITTDPYTIEICEYYRSQSEAHDLPWMTEIFSSYEQAIIWAEKRV